MFSLLMVRASPVIAHLCAALPDTVRESSLSVTFSTPRRLHPADDLHSRDIIGEQNGTGGVGIQEMCLCMPPMRSCDVSVYLIGRVTSVNTAAHTTRRRRLQYASQRGPIGSVLHPPSHLYRRILLNPPPSARPARLKTPTQPNSSLCSLSYCSSHLVFKGVKAT